MLGTLVLLVCGQLGVAMNRAFTPGTFGTRAQRKVVLIGGKPIRDDECRGISGSDGNGELRQSGSWCF